MGHIVFPYEGVLPEDFNIQPNYRENALDKYKIIRDPERDSIHVWFGKTLKDSLTFQVQYQNEKDTFVTLLRSKTYDSLKVSSKTRGVLGLDKNFFITFNQPLSKIDTSQITLIAQDSIPQKLSLRYHEESMEVQFYFQKAENSIYSLTGLPGAFSGQNEIISDTLKFKMQTGSIENYGDLTLTFRSKESEEIIVELLDEQENIVTTKKTVSTQKVLFSLLKPDKYKVRVRIDKNKNGKWDTGNFLNKQQPEPIVFFPNLLNIRPNFSENEIIDLIQ
jgi:hypothetical protein